MSVSNSARRLVKRYGATITLTRSTPAAPDPETPWQPGTLTVDVYELDARVTGAAAQYVDGTDVVASDLMVVASPKAKHTLTDDAPADGVVADLEPRMDDTLQIDGVAKSIKKIVPARDGDEVGILRIFVAS